MSITTEQGFILGSVSIHQVALAKTLGGYELNVCFQFNIQGKSDDTHAVKGLRLIQAEVRINDLLLGLARPKGFDIIEVQKHPWEPQWSFYLPLNAGQIGEIESIRSASDFTLKSLLLVEILGTERLWHSNEDCRKNIARSDWLEQLGRAGYMDTLLVDIPMPISESAPRFENLKKYLLEAQRHFHNGEFTSAVVSCRKVMEELQHLERSDFQNPQVQQAKLDRSQNKAEREAILLRSLHHYMHLAGHSESENGVNFSRADAQMLIQMTAAIVRNTITP